MRSAEAKDPPVVRRMRRRLAEAAEVMRVDERIRNQWEIVDLEHRLSEALDKRVRYALVVFGMTNAAAVLVLTRFDHGRTSVAPASWAIRSLGLAYALLAVKILRDALRALRPRLSIKELDQVIRQRVLDDPSDTLVSRGVLPVESSRPSHVEYHARWQRITGEELSRQLSVVSLSFSTLADDKLVALRHLYKGLSVSVLLTACLVIILLLVGSA